MSSDNLTDSPDGPTCSICFYKLNDTPYAMINDPGETGKYHVQCLEQWIQKSNRGILIEKKIDSYSIYHEDKLIETIVNKKLQVPFQNDQTNTNETTVLIPSNEDNDDNDNDSSDSGQEYPCYYQFNRGQVLCASIAVIIVLCLLLFSYLIKRHH